MFQRNSDSPFSSDAEHALHTAEDTVETVVGPSVVVEGDFSSEGNILVKGTVSGNVKTGKLLTVEQGAKILANVKADSATISGEVKGNIKVDDRLELLESARVMGDIACNVLVIAPGALLMGKVTMRGVDIEDGREKKRGLGRLKIKLGEDQTEHEEVEQVQ